jgi:hypothetical protein
MNIVQSSATDIMSLQNPERAAHGGFEENYSAVYHAPRSSALLVLLMDMCNCDKYESK